MKLSNLFLENMKSQNVEYLEKNSLRQTTMACSNCSSMFEDTPEGKRQKKLNCKCLPLDTHTLTQILS